MRARAALTVERGPDGRGLVRELRCGSPLALLPRRGTVAARDPAVTVHMVGSASTPLAGDDVELDVTVGDGAHLVLTGVAAAVALPGRDRPSSLTVRIAVGAHGSVAFLPEPTVVTARADHRTLLDVTLHPTASLRGRETLVLGRTGERSGRLSARTRIVETTGRPLLVQDLLLGDPGLDGSPAHLAGQRILAQEIVIDHAEPPAARTGDGWSLVPLAGRGHLVTVVAAEAVTAARALDRARPAPDGPTPDRTRVVVADTV